MLDWEPQSVKIYCMLVLTWEALYSSYVGSDSEWGKKSFRAYEC